MSKESNRTIPVSVLLNAQEEKMLLAIIEQEKRPKSEMLRELIRREYERLESERK